MSRHYRQPWHTSCYATDSLLQVNMFTNPVPHRVADHGNPLPTTVHTTRYRTEYPLQCTEGSCMLLYSTSLPTTVLRSAPTRAFRHTLEPTHLASRIRPPDRVPCTPNTCAPLSTPYRALPTQLRATCCVAAYPTVLACFLLPYATSIPA